MKQYNGISNFKAVEPLTNEALRNRAPSVFALTPMDGLSRRYTFVPTTEILDGLRKENWVPVSAEQQRVRSTSRFGFQKHLIRLRQADQMDTLEEWNTELVLTNSHDAGCAYVMRVGIFRRICSNGLVIADHEFEALRFRHVGLKAEDIINGSFKLLQHVSQVGMLIDSLRRRFLNETESLAFAVQALIVRFENIDLAPIEPDTLLTPRRPEDEGKDAWTIFNRVQENLVRGGLSDTRRDGNGRVRTLRALTSIDTKIAVNVSLWQLARQLLDGRN